MEIPTWTETDSELEEENSTDSENPVEVTGEGDSLESFEEDFSDERDEGGRDRSAEAEWTDEDEIIDESDADLTYDKMIRERLLQGTEASSASDREADRSDPVIPSNPVSDSSPRQPVSENEGDIVERRFDSSSPSARRDFEDRENGVLEELRLLELEVSQEVDVIRKIRKMQSGLESFRTGSRSESGLEQGLSSSGGNGDREGDEPDPGTGSRPVSDSSTSSDPRPTPSPAPEKPSVFKNIFEKIYSEKKE